MRRGFRPSEVFYDLIAQAAFGEQRADEIGLEVAAKASRLVDDEEPVLDGLLGVGQGAFAHSGKRIVGTLGKVFQDQL
jgi:hypothetical protein